MPNYFDYISEAADRYEEPEFIEESVNDSFNETIADMDLYCFQESLLVGAIVVGALALIGILLKVVSKIIRGTSSSSGLKLQNKTMKKAVDSIKSSGVETIDFQPEITPTEKTQIEITPRIPKPEPEPEYMDGIVKDNTKEGKSRGNKPKPLDYDNPVGKSNERVIKTAPTPWQQPIWIVNSEGGEFMKCIDNMNEFIRKSIDMFNYITDNNIQNIATNAMGNLRDNVVRHDYTNLGGSTKPAPSGEKMGPLYAKLNSLRLELDRITVIPVKDKTKIYRLMSGPHSVDEFSEHIRQTDRAIEVLERDLNDMKTIERRLKASQDAGKAFDPWGGNNTSGGKDPKGRARYQKNTATCDANAAIITKANGQTAAAVKRLKDFITRGGGQYRFVRKDRQHLDPYYNM